MAGRSELHGRSRGDRLFRLLLTVAAVAVPVLMAFLVFELAQGARPAIGRYGLGFLTSSTWDPVAERFGAFPLIVGTLLSSLLALAIAVPLSLGVAIFLTAAALLFIGFTIQTAVFSRRREIEVMKLVGATNWFIRVPFMLEGVVQGVIGSALGITGIYGLNSLFENRLQPDDAVGLLSNFGVSGGELFTTSLLLFLGAIFITAVASAVAVSFYVNV